MLDSKLVLNSNKVGMLITVNKNEKMAFSFVITEEKILSNNSLIENAEKIHFLHCINGRVINTLVADSELGKSFINGGAFVDLNARFAGSCKKNGIVFFGKIIPCGNGFLY